MFFTLSFFCFFRWCFVIFIIFIFAAIKQIVNSLLHSFLFFFTFNFHLFCAHYLPQLSTVNLRRLLVERWLLCDIFSRWKPKMAFSCGTRYFLLLFLTLYHFYLLPLRLLLLCCCNDFQFIKVKRSGRKVVYVWLSVYSP